jgi:hypothetical protein
METGALAGRTDVLAREPATEDVDRLNRIPVDLGDVTVVRYVGPVVGEDLGWCLVDLAEPGRLGAEHLRYGHVESAVARE